MTEFLLAAFSNLKFIFKSFSWSSYKTTILTGHQLIYFIN